ncbi:ATP-binding protein [Lachnospiraceae bacterium 54-53]
MNRNGDGIIRPFADENYWTYGNITRWIEWDMMTKDGYRILLSGPSGSGKTTLAHGILCKLAKNVPECQIYILDYKNIDFSYLEGAKHYFKHDLSIDGFLMFYDLFETRLMRNSAYSWSVLYIDEYPSWLASIPSKEQKEIMSKMGRLLNLSRAKQIHIMVSCQKPLAELFSAGSRESFSHKILIQAPSKETIGMIMPNFKDLIETCPTGVGYLTVNDSNLTKIRVPFPKNIEAMHRDLWNAVNR